MLLGWRTLILQGSHSQIPPILVKAQFSRSSYEVFLTDLTHIWTETLERKQIIRRALNEETSIDPSEDADQLSLFLLRIEDALQGKTNANACLRSGNVEDNLDLITSTILPASLKPLEWTFHLALGPQSMLTSELILPCISEMVGFNAQVSSLLQVVRMKDNLITKLVDKIESEGTDISKLFPVAPRSLGAASNLNGKSIRGFEALNEEQWRKQRSESSGYPRTLRDALSNGLGSVTSGGPELTVEHVSDSWWRHLTASPDVLAIRNSQTLRSQDMTSCQDSMGTEEVFQVSLDLILLICSREAEVCRDKVHPLDS